MAEGRAPADPTPLFPAFLKLRGRPVAVVGGGPVAASKLRALLAAGARVTVVAPEVTAEIARSGVAVRRRPFRDSDLDGAWLAVAAAPAEVNREVARAAAERRLFVNAVDDPPNASLYLGGVVRRGGVTAAISTDGRAPALAGLVREAIEALLPVGEVQRWLAAAEEERTGWLADRVPMDRRRPLLVRVLAALYDDRTSTGDRPAAEGSTRNRGSADNQKGRRKAEWTDRSRTSTGERPAADGRPATEGRPPAEQVARRSSGPTEDRRGRPNRTSPDDVDRGLEAVGRRSRRDRD